MTKHCEDNNCYRRRDKILTKPSGRNNSNCVDDDEEEEMPDNAVAITSATIPITRSARGRLLFGNSISVSFIFILNNYYKYEHIKSI